MTPDELSAKLRAEYRLGAEAERHRLVTLLRAWSQAFGNGEVARSFEAREMSNHVFAACALHVVADLLEGK